MTPELKGIHAKTFQDLDVIKDVLKLDEEKIADLEKENSELKGIKDVATLIRANNDTVITLMQLNNKLVSKSQQLTKAKKLLKDITSSYGSTEVSEAQFYLKIKKAEIFLKECR